MILSYEHSLGSVQLPTLQAQAFSAMPWYENQVSGTLLSIKNGVSNSL